MVEECFKKIDSIWCEGQIVYSKYKSGDIIDIVNGKDLVSDTSFVDLLPEVLIKQIITCIPQEHRFYAIIIADISAKYYIGSL